MSNIRTSLISRRFHFFFVNIVLGAMYMVNSVNLINVSFSVLIEIFRRIVLNCSTWSNSRTVRYLQVLIRSLYEIKLYLWIAMSAVLNVSEKLLNGVL